MKNIVASCFWKDELCTDEISEAISARNTNGLDESLSNFDARGESKLDVIEKKLDGVEQIPLKIIPWIFIYFCILFVAYMASGK